MIRLSDIHDDYYSYDEAMHCVIGERSGKKYKLGQKIRVVVVDVYKDAGEIDMMPGEGGENDA